MKIQSIVFDNSYIRSFTSLVYARIFNKVNLYFFSNLKKKEFDYNFKLGPTGVLIKTIQCGYCGTDKNIVTFDFSFGSSVLLDTNKHKNKLIYLGHEVVGRVVKVGDKVTNFKNNDKIIVDSVNRGEKIDNEDIFGGFTNFFIKDQKKIKKINNKISDNEAILIEPLACGLEAIKKINIKKNDKILIVGAGIIGVGIAHLLRCFYKKSINITIATNSLTHKKMLNFKLVDNIIFRKDLFKESKKILKTQSFSFMNNKILADGYDKIFECSGNAKIINKVLRISKKSADIVLTGMTMQNTELDPSPIWHRNLNIYGSHGYKLKYPSLKLDTFDYIAELILKKKIDLKKLKIKKINFQNWKKLFKEDNKEFIKKVLIFK